MKQGKFLDDDGIDSDGDQKQHRNQWIAGPGSNKGEGTVDPMASEHIAERSRRQMARLSEARAKTTGDDRGNGR